MRLGSAVNRILDQLQRSTLEEIARLRGDVPSIGLGRSRKNAAGGLFGSWTKRGRCGDVPLACWMQQITRDHQLPAESLPRYDLSRSLRISMHPKSEELLECSLYVDDVAVSARFYKRIFGFRVVSDFGDRGCAMQAGNRQVLFKVLCA